MPAVPWPAIELRCYTELFGLQVQCAEVCLEMSYLFGAHSEDPFNFHYFPMLYGYVPTASSPADFLSFGKYHHCGNRPGQ